MLLFGLKQELNSRAPATTAVYCSRPLSAVPGLVLGRDLCVLQQRHDLHFGTPTILRFCVIL